MSSDTRATPVRRVTGFSGRTGRAVMKVWRVLAFRRGGICTGAEAAHRTVRIANRWKLCALATWTLAALPGIVHPAEGNRIALVIGNATYAEKPLATPARDAELLAGVLRERLKFDVVLERNVGRVRLIELIEEFGQRARGADAAVFYFSGRGMQDSGKRNYLMPVDARVRSNTGIRAWGVQADEVVELLTAAAPRVSLVVLDASRDNPYLAGTKDLGVGLSRIEARSNRELLIAYATRENEVAPEGTGQNSPFAAALANRLAEAGSRPILNLFDAVADEVGQQTGQRQRPTRYGDLKANTYLVASAETRPEPKAAATVEAAVVSGDADGRAKAKHEWATWQEQMSIAFARAQAMGGEVARQLDASRRFLAGYPENNPYSEDDERLREAARKRVGDLEAEMARGKQQPERPPLSSFRDCPDCPEMVVIPKGSFLMGALGEESALADTDETPQHRVSLGYQFALAKFEVTQRQWKALMSENPSYFKSCGEDCPVGLVSWDEAQEYLKRLSAKTGKPYRLPSEAEWEYACRAGGQHAYCGGNDPAELAWYDLNSGFEPRRIGGRRPNAFGLYDMSGNVWEWVEDCWNGTYDGAPADGSAWRSGECKKRVLRGGSWYSKSKFARAANRSRFDTPYRGIINGIRVARTLP
jgi:formylglycine-generating enzyme required for sulfatase activity